MAGGGVSLRGRGGEKLGKIQADGRTCAHLRGRGTFHIGLLWGYGLSK